MAFWGQHFPVWRRPTEFRKCDRGAMPACLPACLCMYGIRMVCMGSGWLSRSYGWFGRSLVHGWGWHWALGHMLPHSKGGFTGFKEAWKEEKNGNSSLICGEGRSWLVPGEKGWERRRRRWRRLRSDFLGKQMLARLMGAVTRTGAVDGGGSEADAGACLMPWKASPPLSPSLACIKAGAP